MFSFEKISLFWANRLSFAARRELAQRFREADFDVTPKEWAILLILWKEGSRTPSELADATVRDRTTVTRLIDRMVRKGLVEREVASTDRRKSILRPTAKGQQLQQHLVPIARQLVAEAQQGISADDIQTTVRTLRAMTENLTNREPKE